MSFFNCEQMEPIDLTYGQAFKMNYNVNQGLFAAIEEGNPDNVWRMFLQGANIQNANLSSFGCFPLTYAIWMAKYEIAIILLELGVNPNAADLQGRIPLLMALCDKCGDRGMTSPNHFDDKRTKMEFRKVLIAKGANVNVEDYNCSKSALNLAILNSDYEITKLLVQNGADLKYCDRGGLTPIRAAIDVGNFPIVELLLLKGADLTQSNFDGDTPLIEAIENANRAKLQTQIGGNHTFWHNSLKIVKILIEHGADVNLSKSSMKRTYSGPILAVIAVTFTTGFVIEALSL